MRELSATLTDLIEFAEGVVTRPRSNHEYAGHFSILSGEVRHAELIPAEGIRTTRAARVMIIAIEEFRQSDQEPGSRWLMLVGATLPLLRADAWLAMKNEKEARQG